MVEVTVELKLSADMLKFQRWLERGEKFEVRFETYQASTTEFGTGPAAMHANYTPPLEPILQWVINKFHYSDKKALRVARSIQYTISKQGTQPHPFARPAIADAVFVIGSLVKEGAELGSLGERIANYIRDRAREYMVQNGQVVTGELYREIYVVEVPV